MPNNRPSGGTAFVRAVAPGGAAVYRTEPRPGASTASLPALGAVAGTDVYQEVFADGATTPSYLLVAKAGQVRGETIAVGVNA